MTLRTLSIALMNSFAIPYYFRYTMDRSWRTSNVRDDRRGDGRDLGVMMGEMNLSKLL